MYAHIPVQGLYTRYTGPAPVYAYIPLYTLCTPYIQAYTQPVYTVHSPYTANIRCTGLNTLY